MTKGTYPERGDPVDSYDLRSLRDWDANAANFRAQMIGNILEVKKCGPRFTLKLIINGRNGFTHLYEEGYFIICQVGPRVWILFTKLQNEFSSTSLLPLLGCQPSFCRTAVPRTSCRAVFVFWLPLDYSTEYPIITPLGTAVVNSVIFNLKIVLHSLQSMWSRCWNLFLLVGYPNWWPKSTEPSAANCRAPSGRDSHRTSIAGGGCRRSRSRPFSSRATSTGKLQQQQTSRGRGIDAWANTVDVRRGGIVAVEGSTNMVPAEGIPEGAAASLG
ncbi:hypothetical protein M9H77_36137 [Catharanthus roseus]|uniref:Uncharacterized protein n=1 Tax=Catharanthus roseus TaxID=4058 RepID=A0ACB9ZV78_CATRO|nr:hypothetical protein M9H77_36137 [Catharanthus roseus]